MTEDRRELPLPLVATQPPSSFGALLDQNGLRPDWSAAAGDGLPELAEATTILAVRYADGVVMVGDRQATEGYTVAHRRIQKVYDADQYSAVAISGVAGIAVIRLSGPASGTPSAGGTAV